LYSLIDSGYELQLKPHEPDTETCRSYNLSIYCHLVVESHGNRELVPVKKTQTGYNMIKNPTRPPLAAAA